MRTFEEDDKFRASWVDADGAPLTRFERTDEARGQSLAVPVAFPETSGAWRQGIRLLMPAKESAAADGDAEAVNGLVLDEAAWVPRELRYDVFVPDTLRPPAQVWTRAALKDKDGAWYDTPGERRDAAGRWMADEALRPGWNTVRVDLSERAAWIARGHQARWSRHQLSKIRALGLTFRVDAPYDGEVLLDNAELRFVRSEDFPPLAVTALAFPGDAAVFDLAEFAFALNRPLVNPFRQS
jgi:hypothetical protein